MSVFVFVSVSGHVTISVWSCKRPCGCAALSASPCISHCLFSVSFPFLFRSVYLCGSVCLAVYLSLSIFCLIFLAVQMRLAKNRAARSMLLAIQTMDTADAKRAIRQTFTTTAVSRTSLLHWKWLPRQILWRQPKRQPVTRRLKSASEKKKRKRREGKTSCQTE